MKMDNPKFAPYFILAVFGLFLASCAQISGIQTAQTLGKNRAEIMATVGGVSSFALSDIDSGLVSDFFFVLPVVELAGRFGVAENADVGLKVSTSLSVTAEGKYQFLGDKGEGFAMAIGGSIGTQGIAGARVFQTQIPLYMSYHPTDKFAVYGSPAYIAQFGGILSGQTLQYAGFSAGVEFGRNVAVPIDFSWFKIVNIVDGLPAIFQISTGFKFRFGGR
ncbi:MAG: hypothetical protein KDC44_13950 [Phaeodactylibacter sp.]|nr:hypothetical protein [Phaeodactylibacter sp.]